MSRSQRLVARISVILVRRLLYQSQIQIAFHRVFTLRENTLLL
jgi:hypothetical protein